MFTRSPSRRGRNRLAITLVIMILMLQGTLIAAAAPAGPLALPVIDHFDSIQGPLSAVLGTPASSSVADAAVLGGERDIVVTVLPTSQPAPSGMEVTVGSSTLASNQDSGVFGQALITYDGIDGNPTTLNPTGLGGVDLTQAGATNGFDLTSRLNDLPVDIVITVHTNATSASQATITLPGGQPSASPPVTYYIEFAAFTQAPGATSPANFTSVGAIQLLVDGFNDATDLSIEDFKVTSFDWGDLPDNSVGGPNYPTTFANNGPRHVIGSLFLGALIDPVELNGIPSTEAIGDDISGLQDEDGVSRTGGVLWNSGAAGGSVDVFVTGGPGCLSAWIDWGNDGNLTNGGDNILNNEPVNSGANTLTFFIPVEPGSGTFYARFRLYAQDAAGGCTSAKAPTGRANNGEVEDYRWSFGPNAIRLSSLSATSAGSSLPVGAAVLGLLGALAGAAGLVWSRRH